MKEPLNQNQNSLSSEQSPVDLTSRSSKEDIDLLISATNSIEKKRKSSKIILLQSGIILLMSVLYIFLLIPSDYDWRSNLPKLFARKFDSNEPRSQDSFSDNVLPVETVSIQPVSSYQASRTYTGFLAPRSSSELGFERFGKLARLTVDEGKWVEAGRPLAYLDFRNLKVQKRELLAKQAQEQALLEEMKAGPRSQTIEVAQATIKDLNFQLELARKKRSRREALYMEGAIPKEQLDEITGETNVLQARLDKARSRLDELLSGTRRERIEAQRASVEQLNANLAALKIKLEKSILKAPFAGSVSKLQVDEGAIVSPNQPILRLVENRILEARIGVPVAIVNKIQLNSYQTLQIGDKNYGSRVSSILPELNSTSHTVTVVLTLNNSSVEEIFPSQVARLQLNKEISTVGYWLPINALVKGVRGLQSCYVLGESVESTSSDLVKAFQIEQRDVEVLQIESNRVLVRGTLQSDDRVIVSGLHRLVAEQLVRLIE